MPFTFVAKADGTLTGVEIVFDYHAIHRKGMRCSVQRGVLSEFFEPYVDLQADLQLARLEATKGPGDRVRRERQLVTVFVVAPQR